MRREVVRAATGLAILLPAAVSWIGIADPLWIFLNPENRTIHDLLGNTRVIDESVLQ